jgi:hypothetical protein
LGEKVAGKVRWEYHLSRIEHGDGEYTSDTGHQDGSLPYRMQITYEDGGPQYRTVEYFPHFHFQAAYALAREDYSLLTDYWGRRDIDGLEDLEAESALVDELAEEGAVEALESYVD